MLRAIGNRVGGNQGLQDAAPDTRFIFTESSEEVSADAPSSFSPDARLYTEFIIAACRCGRPSSAVEVFQSPNFPKTSYTYPQRSKHTVNYLSGRGLRIYIS